MDKFIKLDIPKGYEYIGIDLADGKLLLKKKPIEFPKTFEECCETVNTINSGMPCVMATYLGHPIANFAKLIIMRDAYWKIDNNWKPMKSSAKAVKRYVITTMYDEAVQMETSDMHYFVLEFRTKELRDTFYANFKGLIEQCKEFL